MTTTTNAPEYVALRDSAPPAERTRRRPLRPGRVALYALLVAGALSAIFPILWMISGSMQSLPELLKGDSLLPAVPQWQNFATAWVKGDLAVYLTNSVVYTLCAVAGILLVSSLAGYALARIQFRGKAIFTALILAVMIIPAPAMFLAQYKVLLALDLANTRQGYILILITSGIPISTLIMRSFFASQPVDLEEAASLDGASALRTFFSIMLPLAKPGLAAVAVIQAFAVWNEYLMALVIFNDTSLMPVQRGLTSFVSAETPQPQILLAATLISIVPVLVFYLFAQRQIVDGISAGAIK
ncbi:carbohydrate ABC transporter permease [Leifsonia sp. SIMBA_070]|uniref:carbohydrate ABC transporter permease n=1 Tax=Leifsonia sp. SIMBA_070 TaxID=3085810 RepID=UPI00397AC2F5